MVVELFVTIFKAIIVLGREGNEANLLPKTAAMSLTTDDLIIANETFQVRYYIIIYFKGGLPEVKVSKKFVVNLEARNFDFW